MEKETGQIATKNQLIKSPNERLLSLDLFRGLAMFLLVAEGTRVYSALSGLGAESSILGKIVMQFHHHEWYLCYWLYKKRIFIKI